MNQATPCTTTPANNINDQNRFFRTTLEANFRVHKDTGEILGGFTYHDYAPEPCDYPIPAAGSAYVIHEDGSPIEVCTLNVTAPSPSAVVLPFPQQPTEIAPSSNAGRKPAVISNPIASLLNMLRFDGHPTGWIDDYICGAAGMEVECEGSDTATTGHFNVAPSDIRKVLYLSEISTEVAIGVLCNHDLQPMSVRQAERVVKAARIALGGLVTYLEKHQELLQQFDCTVDFDEFWRRRNAQARGESPEQTEAITLHSQGWSIAKIAKQVGRHRNTVGRWIQESEAA